MLYKFLQWASPPACKSTFLFCLYLQLIAWGSAMFRMAVCLIHSTISNVNHIKKHLRVWPNSWALCGLVKLTDLTVMIVNRQWTVVKSWDEGAWHGLECVVWSSIYWVGCCGMKWYRMMWYRTKWNKVIITWLHLFLALWFTFLTSTLLD